MELSFNGFLILLTSFLVIIDGQNTTDYDYETTGFEETDNITELPKTTTTVKTITSTVLPEENYWIKEDTGDTHFCHCNLKIDECDINCCCDVDCTKDMIKAFDCLSDANYLRKEDVCHKKSGWLCIFKGLGEKVETYNEDLRSTVQKFTWNQETKLLEEFKFSTEYKIGDPVLFYSEEQKKYSTLDLPHMEFGIFQPIRHLQPWITEGKFIDMENISHFLKTPTENATSNIEFFICNNECVATTNRTLPKNPFLIEILFTHNFTNLVSSKFNYHFKNISKASTKYKVSFETVFKKSIFELSGPKGYLFHKPIIVRRNESIIDYLKLPFVNEKVLFGENVLMKTFSKANSCEVFRNFTIDRLNELKELQFSELGAPKNSSNLWHFIEVDLESLGVSCENFTNQFFFNFEYARSKVDNIQHQNLLKRVVVNTGSPGRVDISRNGEENGVYTKIGIMFYDLTDVVNSGQSYSSSWILRFLVYFIFLKF